MTSHIIEFGKYRGQSIEALARDRNYCEWLMQQPWFLEKYPLIVALIKRDFKEPEETPDHNALQVLFTDDKFIERFLAHCFSVKIVNPSVRFEVRGVDVVIDFEYNERMITGSDGKPCRYADQARVCVECKPNVGDDYPAVLRQMKMQRERASDKDWRTKTAKFVLFIGLGGYTGMGATLEQVRKIFKSGQIHIVLLKELDDGISDAAATDREAQ